MASKQPRKNVFHFLEIAGPALTPEVPDGADEPEMAAPALRSEPPAPAVPVGTLKERTHQMSLYLEPEVYDFLREISFKERTKMHSLLLQAVEQFLQAHGFHRDVAVSKAPTSK